VRPIDFEGLARSHEIREGYVMSLSSILLGLINIAIVVVILLLVGAICKWVLGMLGWGPPTEVERLYIAVVVLIALYMLVALVFGLPTVHIIRGPLASLQFLAMGG
jgi:hypothetical protein